MLLHFITMLLLMSSHSSIPDTDESAPTSGSMLITISNIRSNTGKVNVSVFAKADGFPSTVEKAVAVRSVSIQQNQVSLRFDNLPFGTYAVACHHDENENGKMDTNLLGIPKEGYGASNNAVNKFSAPKFEAAKFPFNAAVLSVNFKMHYW